MVLSPAREWFKGTKYTVAIKKTPKVWFTFNFIPFERLRATIIIFDLHFGTFEAIENASSEDIEKVTNKKISNIIKNYNQ